MNIKEHIEAGHYPKDANGYSLVPARGGRTATVALTNRAGRSPLIGWFDDWEEPDAWDANGRCRGGSTPSPYDLLPPPPHKVKVEALAIVIAGTSTILALRDPNNPPAGIAAGAERLVTLTGEYEEPWP